MNEIVSKGRLKDGGTWHYPSPYTLTGVHFKDLLDFQSRSVGQDHGRQLEPPGPLLASALQAVL